jgi:hypothetical protein
MNQPQLFATEQITRTSDDYWTPKWIFDALGLTFDLDVACPPEGPAHTPCHAYYTQKDNGLTAPWHGLVWMNPPFSKTTPWIHKFIEHDNGVALVPYVKSKWQKIIFDAADAMVLLPHNTKFDVAEGKRGDIPYLCVLYAMGKQATKALKHSNLGRVR